MNANAVIEIYIYIYIYIYYAIGVYYNNNLFLVSSITLTCKYSLIYAKILQFPFKTPTETCEKQLFTSL